MYNKDNHSFACFDRETNKDKPALSGFPVPGHKENTVTAPGAVKQTIFAGLFSCQRKNMFRFIIAFLMLVPSTSFSQLYINKTKSRVKGEIGKVFFGKDNISASISETDSSLVMKVRGTGTTEADYIYSFDKSGKCSAEKTVTGCDSCHVKLFQPVLAQKKYRWKKINLNQYISKFSAAVFIELQATGNTYSFTIFRLKLKRKMYGSLLKNK